MVQFRAIDRRRSATELYETIARRNEDFKKMVLSEMVDVVVEAGSAAYRSRAVDTGTYMESHEISYGGRSGSFKRTKSSHDKMQRDVPPEPEVEKARARLHAAVEMMPRDSLNIMFRNTAKHAPLVEYKYGYAPYGKARREFNNIVKSVAGLMGVALR
jgi:hypothetical protein